jgi:hypothetical protein
MTLMRAWAARHAFLTAWAALSIIIAGLLALTGHRDAGTIVLGIALGLVVTVATYLFDPIPAPLSRENWLMRAPILSRLARIRHWANPFYVEAITLRSPYRPSYCSSELSASIISFPWFPIKAPNIAGRVTGRRFVLKRVTFWADGGRPTAAGEFADAEPGTRIDLHVAAPAVGVYFFLLFTVMVVAMAAAFAFGLAISTRTLTPVALVIGAAAFVVLIVFAIVGSPLSPKVPFLGQPPESDRYVAFFRDVLGADVTSRE